MLCICEDSFRGLNLKYCEDGQYVEMEIKDGKVTIHGLGLLGLPGLPELPGLPGLPRSPRGLVGEG